MAQSNSVLFPVPVSTGKMPPEGPAAVPISYDFSGGVLSYTTDMVQIHQQGKLTMVQTLFIDNSLNNAPVTVVCNVLNQSITVPAGFQGYYPVLCTGQVKFQVSTIGNVSAVVAYINVLLEGFQWSAVAVPGSGGATSLVSDVILDALVTGGRLPVLTTPAADVYTNRSGTVAAGGTSQTVMNANAARKGWMIMNIDEVNLEPMAISFSGAAALATAGSYSLAASGGAGYPGGFMQGTGTAAITIIAATTGHQYTATEW